MGNYASILLTFPIINLMKTFFVAIGVVAAIMVGFTLLNVLGVPLNIVNQGARVINKTVDADNVIYNYEYFKQACEDIEAQNVKIANAETELKNFEASAGVRSEWTFEDKNEHSRLTTNVTGTKNVQQEMVAKYDGRAKMANRAIFNTQPCTVQVTR